MFAPISPMLLQGLFRPVESVYVSMFGDHPVPLGLGTDHVQYARLLPEGVEPETQKFGYCNHPLYTVSSTSKTWAVDETEDESVETFNSINALWPAKSSQN